VVTPEVLADGVREVDGSYQQAIGTGRTPVMIVHTSGSSGGPKGCVLTNDSLLVPARAMVERLAVTSDDVLLNLLPLHHMAGLSFLVTATAAGAATALRGSFKGSRFWSVVRETGATVFRHIGEMLAVLCEQPHDPPEPDHRLRLVYGGGAKGGAAEQFTARFGVQTIEGYGLSETNTVLAGSTTRTVPGTLGQPLPHLQVRVVDAAGGPVTVGEGELEVSANPALMLGYFANPEATARAMHGSWFRTGDLVRRDEAGNFHFVRRLSDVMRRGGENIDPAEIERAAVAYPGVNRAVAVGVPDRVGGVEIRLFVERQPGYAVSGADVARHLTGLLAPFKIPRKVVVGAIPRTTTEKLDKPALVRLIGVP
jgi:carnitine-CoA ligase